MLVNPILVSVAKVILENICKVEEARMFFDTPLMAHFLRIDHVLPQKFGQQGGNEESTSLSEV